MNSDWWTTTAETYQDARCKYDLEHMCIHQNTQPVSLFQTIGTQFSWIAILQITLGYCFSTFATFITNFVLTYIRANPPCVVKVATMFWFHLCVAVSIACFSWSVMCLDAHFRMQLVYTNDMLKVRYYSMVLQIVRTPIKSAVCT